MAIASIDWHGKVQPLMRWAGSKRQILSELAGYWDVKYQRYIEPFAGSAALFFHIKPNAALINDLNKPLIQTYRVLRKHPDSLFAAVTTIPKGKISYYRQRQAVVKDLTPLQKAARFIFLNRFCFNGIFRTNRLGIFNVPYNNGDGKIPTLENFRQCALLLANATLKSADFEDVLEAAGAGDFVYLDPPYAVTTRRVFCEYNRKQFSVDDLARLYSSLLTIEKRGAKFGLSYADCADARNRFKKWTIRRICVKRHVAGFAGSRRKAFELIVTNTN